MRDAARSPFNPRAHGFEIGAFAAQEGGKQTGLVSEETI